MANIGRRNKTDQHVTTPGEAVRGNPSKIQNFTDLVAVVSGPKTVVSGHARIGGQAYVAGHVKISGYTRVLHPIINAEDEQVVPNERIPFCRVLHR